MTDAITVEAVLEEARKNRRVCPMPKKWHDLCALLPGAKSSDPKDWPPAPLILAAWDITLPLSKIIRLQEHIQWAEKHGALDRIYEYMRNLPESDWLHLG